MTRSRFAFCAGLTIGAAATAIRLAAAESRSVTVASNVPLGISSAVRDKQEALACEGDLAISLVKVGAKASLRIVRAVSERPNVVRTVTLPSDAGEQARLAAHLTHNLCVNEAEEWLRSRQGLAASDAAIDSDTSSRDAHSDASGFDPGVGSDAEPSPDDAMVDLTNPPKTLATLAVAIPPKPVAAPVLPPAPPLPAPFRCPVKAYSPVSVGIFSPLALPLGVTSNNFSLSLLYGQVGRTDGVALGALMLHERCETYGLSAAGVLNLSLERTEGLALSGLLNVHVAPVSGATIAPLTYAEDLTGFQGGLINAASRELRGVQFGLINIHTGTLYGLQLGLINVAYEVRGVQLGLINVAKDSDASLGFQSVSWSRKIRPYAWTSNVTPLQVGVEWDAKRLFATLGFGRLLSAIVSQGAFVLGFGIGIHLLRSEEEGFLFDLTAGFDGRAPIGGSRAVDTLRAGARFGYRPMPHFAGYVYGGVASIVESDDARPIETRPFTTFVKPEFGAGVLF
jgi:hypothetical protein